ncbi:MAG: DNA mismatch repair endonuclease MutL [Phycisphaerae bacterium]
MTTSLPTTTSPTAPPHRKIELLPDGLINKIAAGEVVERPASVVKELLENALDAGATRLQIAIENGGRTLIRIVDNGGGIEPDEAPLAFAQHATSKIKSIEDLFAISTMGFRGEALASIASVSHATMVTRPPHQAQAVRIEVHDAIIGPTVPCAGPPGTTLEIRDLFYSVPARRKFLRADATEFGHIHEMVLRIALPNPQVAISLTHNGRSVLDLPATTDHQSRISAALGPELHDQLLPIDFAERGMSITGFAGQPSLARATAKFQYVFLNGRFIRDRSILHALKEAYRGLIEPSHQPIAVLFLQMDPVTFDVNVHPQKTEVRFRDSSGPYSVVLAAVRERLLSSDLTPGMRVGPRPQRPTAGDTPSTGEASPFNPRSTQETQKIIADFFKQAPPANTQPNLGFSRSGADSSPPVVSTRWPAGRADEGGGIGTTVGATTPPTHLVPTTIEHTHYADTGMPRMNDQALVAEAAATLPPISALESPATAMPQDEDAARPPKFIQLHNTYIIVETPDGLLILDQHALHERIIYQEMLDRAARGPLEGQRLLIPEIIPVTPRQQAALELVGPLLADLGIDVAEFDAQSIAVHSFPSLLSKLAPRELVRDVLDKLQELGPKLSREELLHEVLDMASCKAAVKAGYPLSHDEIAALLERRTQTERSSNCPHGRPTTLRLTINDLERQFKRK